MSIYKDILIQSSDGALHEDTFRYSMYLEEDRRTCEEEVAFISCHEVKRCYVSTSREEHLEHKLENSLEVLKDYTARSERRIRKIEDENVREESWKAYSDLVVSIMQQVGRITLSLIRRGNVEVEDELAILCANFYTGTRDTTND